MRETKEQATLSAQTVRELIAHLEHDLEQASRKWRNGTWKTDGEFVALKARIAELDRHLAELRRL